MVQIIKTTASQLAKNTAKTTSQETLKKVIVMCLGIGIIIVIIVGIIFLIMMLIMKIQTKIKDLQKRKKDFLFYTFDDNLNFAHNNRNRNLKYKTFKTLFLLWKREPVYINTSEGVRPIGLYDGEAFKKENFLMISVYNKMGMFKVMKQIILIPLSIKSIVHIEIINNKKVLIIDCEGFDEVGNTDYYMIPLVKDNKKPTEFLDFSDYVHKHFFEKIVYRDLIKENLLEYRDGIIKSVEMNPNLQHNRRS